MSAAHTQPGSAKTVADILTAAADLIEPEGCWTQGAIARTKAGRCADRDLIPRSPVCFCAGGAIVRVTGGRAYHPGGPARPAIDALQKSLGVWSVIVWNDEPERTQAEVVAALRAAAEKARTASAVGTTVGREPQSPTTREGADR